MQTETVARRPREWRRAWNALQTVIKDPDRTDQVFEIIEGLAGNAFENQFQRFAAHPDGQRLLAEKPSLLAALSDRDALRALPEGSFGRAYLAFMEEAGLTAEGLVEADDAAARARPTEDPDVGPDRDFLGDRMRDMHDLWHVLTGYGRDEAGEAANLAFSLGQMWNLGMGLIVGAAIVVGPKDIRLSWARYLIAAYRRGRRTSFLAVAPDEELFPLPLSEVRRRRGVPPSGEFHPQGIAVSDRALAAEGIIDWRSDGEAQAV
jgi:ubiquinone biosynthesis protein COQ4